MQKKEESVTHDAVSFVIKAVVCQEGGSVVLVRHTESLDRLIHSVDPALAAHCRQSSDLALVK